MSSSTPSAMFERVIASFTEAANEGSAAMDAGRYEEGIKIFDEALEICRKVGLDGTGHEARIILARGIAQLRNGRQEEALKAHLEALGLAEKCLDKHDPNLAVFKTDLARVYLATNDLVGAERMFKAAIEICEMHPTATAIFLATTYHDLGYLYYNRLDKPAEAEACYKKALTLRRGEFPKGHRSLHIALHNLGDALGSQGKWEESERAFREILEVQRPSAGASANQDREDVLLQALQLQALTNCLIRQNKSLLEAKTLIEQAIALQRRFVDQDNPELKTSQALLRTITEMAAAQLAAPAKEKRDEKAGGKDAEITDEMRAKLERELVGDEDKDGKKKGSKK
jgi:tetratricopeptide (TPR) repeat protein